jgi:hypothetical protein
MQHFVFLSLLTTRQSVQNRHKHEVTAYQINNSFRKFFLFSSLNRYTRKESDTYKVVSWQEFHLHLHRLTKFATVVDTRREAKTYKV